MKLLDYKYYIWGILLVCTIISCERNIAVSTDDIDTDFFKDDAISRVFLKPGGRESSAGGYMDIRGGSLFDFSEMEKYYHDVDLAYTYGVETGNNLLTMDAKDVSFAEIGEEIEHAYPYKNKGELILFSEVTKEDKAWFDQLASVQDIRRGYDSVMGVLSSKYGAAVQPVKRLTNLKKGDIVLYNAINRKFKSIIYIEDVAGAANGSMVMSIKSDMTEQRYLQKPDIPLHKLSGWGDTLVFKVNTPLGDENYVDLLNRKVSKAEDLEGEDVSQITLLHVYDGISSGFYTMTSSYIGSSYRPELWNWINTLPNRNEMHWNRIDNHVKYLPGKTFEDLRNNNESLRSYGAYIGDNSWTSRFTGSTLVPGFVMWIKDKSNQTMGFLKVLEVDNNIGTCKVVLKYVHKE
ncbi:hypothetical protein [Sphingobacterium paucimobilis]|uniref:Uncharacterized protein n=1 Tax=Sphingobacterium paucimobilis HER1398 TaxID=1346330 RepID=U2HTN9_9SPHI|nr:hypothetical protein [Sphingobacterium paucimobilis]ERJ58640.1 hypothetical protein M472_07665 [Sphingobacterium paucimobilis HER1398]